jgi:hypothetical protein
MDTKKKTRDFYVGCASASLALITGIVLFIYGAAVGDFYAVAPVILIAGAVIAMIGLLKNIRFLAIIPGACYMVAVGLYVTSQMGNISGQLSETGFGATGTSLIMLVLFCVLMVIATILAIIASFMDQGTVH